MGQLEIQMAQQIARENDRNLTRNAEFARVAGEREVTAKAGRGRTFGLRSWTERLRLAHVVHPAH